jgi:hypothetical protein
LALEIERSAMYPANAYVIRQATPDPFERTAVVTQLLRIRQNALRAYSSKPSVTERIRAAMRPFVVAHSGR